MYCRRAHEKNHRRVFLYAISFSTFFFSSLFIYLSFFSLSFNKHLNTNVNGNGFVSFETESENFGTIILQGNQWLLACMLVHPYMYNKSIKTSSFSLLTILYLYIYIFFFSVFLFVLFVSRMEQYSSFSFVRSLLDVLYLSNYIYIYINILVNGYIHLYLFRQSLARIYTYIII